MFRFEKKYILKNSHDLSFNYLDFFIKKKNILKLHEPNEINNLYFDTKQFTNYHLHNEGNFDRYKVRIRWYTKKISKENNFFLEIKKRINRKNIKYKTIIPIKDTSQLKNFDVNYYVKKLNLIYSFEKKSKIFKPFLFNKYKRSYFYYKNKDNRITIDTNLKFSKVYNFKKTFFQNTDLKLIEHKFENNKNNPLVSNNNLILMSGSFSKYLFGVQKLKII